ncbi:hypothetical protein HJG54_29065 [Leptolyngbya sp. NK1-12]|uniref:Uncharacterized protein n=2 Tax=Leptolyngbya sp. NK1-12 TaxID=2547451 RepID=A0AA96WLQ3_9CYAN|nr:hypothetical protein HJG54_29065 [Leptolyngbya sp. NK1-12]
MLTHQSLYEFWHRSQSLWSCKLAQVSVDFLSASELAEIQQLHQLQQVEFGVHLSWKYLTRAGSGQMSWCVDANHIGAVFTDKGLLEQSLPQVYQYQMLDENTLIMSVDKYEETIRLESDCRRLREHRYDGKLIRRVWEHKDEALVA